MHIGDLYAVGSALVWSFALILMRVAGHQIPPIPLTFFKNTVAFILVVITLIVLGEPLFIQLQSYDYFRLVISAVLGIAVADTMIAAALNRLGASLQALADCAYAPSIAFVGFIMFGEMLSIFEIIGGIFVLFGVFVGATMTAEIKNPKDLWVGILLAAAAHIVMAIGILMVRDIFRQESLVWVCSFRFLIGAIAMYLYAVVRFPGRVREALFIGFLRTDMWRTMIPMAILGPFLATLMWVAGFKYLEAGRAAIFNQLSTVFIIILAYFLLGEKLTGRKMAGVLLAITGAVLVATH
ncbi:MAG: DMT family transporter [Porticoccaceae bacterium]